MPSLTIHLTSIHGINKEPNSCICGQTFKTKHRVRKHSITCKIYRDAAVFCEVCNLPFLTNNHLQQHYRTSSHKTVVNKLNKRK
ncbi:hypothetical protein B4U79_18231 [Dinothrombium tinctorium]|uniref:C2H2-type domain-containing protein n=1 Tax=Dinothrombium tinctorium TaxID=1965070 RepID=A0A3S3PRU7_9ACAR|nr:hypothetical protein B4U79_18231 [Dinothrombium tinctorium]